MKQLKIKLWLYLGLILTMTACLCACNSKPLATDSAGTSATSSVNTQQGEQSSVTPTTQLGEIISTVAATEANGAVVSPAETLRPLPPEGKLIAEPTLPIAELAEAKKLELASAQLLSKSDMVLFPCKAIDGNRLLLQTWEAKTGYIKRFDLLSLADNSLKNLYNSTDEFASAYLKAGNLDYIALEVALPGSQQSEQVYDLQAAALCFATVSFSLGTHFSTYYAKKLLTS